MQKVLRKRVLRDLKENLVRYLALGMLIVLGMYVVISLVGAAETVITGVEEQGRVNKVEDGEFHVFVPLTDSQISSLTDRGISIESIFYVDMKQEDTSTIRVFETREEINRIALDEGRLAQTEREVVLEKRYCEEHNLFVGDTITIGDSEFAIAGIGSVPDYDAVLPDLSDSCTDSMQFGLAFMTEEGYALMKQSKDCMGTEQYGYAYRLNGSMTDKELKEAVKELSNLTQFIKASDNPRIEASAEDQVISRISGLVAGVIVMVLFTYVISVFVIHGIEKESSVIGALYALGAKRKDLMFHYLMLPVIVTLIAGVIGTALGFSKWGIAVQMKDCYDYFSIPVFKSVYPGYLLAYGIIMPPVVAAFVNCLVIRKRLSKPVLHLMRHEQKEGRGGRMDLGNMGFIARFRIRQMLKEARTGFTVLFGMFIALLIVMLGMDCYVMCRHISEDNKADTKFEYMYTYKYPEEQVPDGGEGCFAKTLKKEIYGYNLDVTLLGIEKDNPYFDADVTKAKNEIIISSAMAEKYGLSIKDKVILTDEEEERDYAFTVAGITQYSTGLYAFMDIQSMRELFDEEEEYYNVVLSDHELSIDSGRLYDTTSKADISKSSDIFISKMQSMIYMLLVVSILIFCVVMYLMMKVMIDRSAFSIALIKIFGYRMGEIRKLYLNGNFYMIAVGAVICIPLAKKAMDGIYPLLISNVGCGMNLTFTWQLYAAIYGGIILLYLLINQMLVARLKKIVPVEVLKNRE